MDKNKDYYIVPGVTIGAQGLPGGHLEAKKEHLKIEKKFFDIIGPSIDFLMTEKKIIDGESYAKLLTSDSPEEEEKKESKRGRPAKQVEPIPEDEVTI